MTPSAPVKPDACPLCGQANQCAMALELASGAPQPPCWCTQLQFSQDVLSRVPEDAQGKACVCAACARTANA